MIAGDITSSATKKISKGALASFHNHTDDSNDSHQTPEQLFRAAQSAGIRYLAISDHNTYKIKPKTLELAERYGLVLIPAFEWSLLGFHWIVLHQDPVVLAEIVEMCNVTSGTTWDWHWLRIENYLQKFKELGAITIAPHPGLLLMSAAIPVIQWLDALQLIDYFEIRNHDLQMKMDVINPLLYKYYTSWMLRVANKLKFAKPIVGADAHNSTDVASELNVVNDEYLARLWTENPEASEIEIIFMAIAAGKMEPQLA